MLEILRNEYGLDVDYSKAGSLDMMTADLSGRNYLFPSSSIALEYYEELHGSPKQSEIILNTPIVLYTHKIVLDAFEQQGLITKDGEVNYIDMNQLVAMIQNDTKWADIGVPELYGSVSVDTTDPAKSNSGNMFAALLADVLNGGQTLTPEGVERFCRSFRLFSANWDIWRLLQRICSISFCGWGWGRHRLPQGMRARSSSMPDESGSIRKDQG